jgi:hypothetical protein
MIYPERNTMLLRNNQLIETTYDLPEYDIGYVVGYTSNGKYAESEIIALSLSAAFDERLNTIVTQIVYDLDNGETVLEEDIEYFYEPTDAVEVG